MKTLDRLLFAAALLLILGGCEESDFRSKVSVDLPPPVQDDLTENDFTPVEIYPDGLIWQGRSFASIRAWLQQLPERNMSPVQLRACRQLPYQLVSAVMNGLQQRQAALRFVTSPAADARCARPLVLVE